MSQRNNSKKKKLIRLYQPEQDESDIEQESKEILNFILHKILLVLYFIGFAIIFIIKQILKTILYLILCVVEFFVYLCPKKKNPIRRRLSNENYKRLLNFASNEYNGEQNKTLILEIDKIFVHLTKTTQGLKQIKIQYQDLNGSQQQCDVTFRPYSQQFIKQISLFYNIIIFTTLDQDLAIQIVHYLDPNNLIKNLFFRKSCIKHPKGLIKDLSVVTKNITNCIMLDHSTFSSSINKQNAYIIQEWNGIPDSVLLDQLEILKQISESELNIKDLLEEINNN